MGELATIRVIHTHLANGSFRNQLVSLKGGGKGKAPVAQPLAPPIDPDANVVVVDDTCLFPRIARLLGCKRRRVR